MTKRLGCLWLVLLICSAVSPFAYGSSELDQLLGESLVSSVTVRLEFPAGKVIHESIAERISQSIEKVAEKVLVGQEISLVKKTEAEVAQLMKAVFDKVFWGYQVTDVDLVFGKNTFILIDLRPTSILIEEVGVDLQIRGVNQQIVEVVAKEVESLEKRIEQILLGLPVDALIWASDLTEPLIYHLVKWQLPGFQPKIDLKIGSKIDVNLTLVPDGQLVEEIELNLITRSLPRIVTTALEKRLERELIIFQGMPVELLEKFQEQILELIEEKIINSNQRNRYIYLNQPPKLRIAPVTQLTLVVDWIDYRFDILGEVVIGSEGFLPALTLSLGKDLGPNTIIKLANQMTLDDLLGTLSLGLEHSLGAGFSTKFAYKFKESEIDAALDWQRSKYGLTIAQTYPGEAKETKLSLNYYPELWTKLSLVYQNSSFWLSLEKAL